MHNKKRKATKKNSENQARNLDLGMGLYGFDNPQKEIGKKIYEAVLTAKREFKINNIALELKISSLHNRVHLLNRNRMIKRISRWKLFKHVFKFIFCLREKLTTRNLTGVSVPDRLFSENDEKARDPEVLNWLSGEAIFKSVKLVKRKKYLFYPDSLFLRLWTYLYFVLFFYTALFLPYRIAFIQNETTFLKALDQIVNVLFLLDIVFTFFTTYTRKNVLVDDLRKIVSRYAKSWLVLDIVSIFPFDYFITTTNNNLNDITKLFRIVKLLRILGLIKMSTKLSRNKFIKKITGLLNINRQFHSLFSFFNIILLLTYIASCLWYFLIQLSTSETWLDRLNPRPVTSIDLYIASFYWAITTICTVGFGDILPLSMVEKLFNILWIGVGVAFYSYTLGTLSNLLNALNKKKSVISNRFAFLNEFAVENKIDKALLERTTINLEFLEESKTYTRDNISLSFLKDISIDLTYQISKHVHKELIGKCVLFETHNLNFLAQMMPFLLARKLRAGEIIYKRNEYPSFIYFILEGSVGFFNESNLMFNTYVEGSYFGEVELFKSSLRQHQTKALTDMKMLLLPRDALLNGLSCFQELAEKLYKKSILRDITNKRNSKYVRKMQVAINPSLFEEDENTKIHKLYRECYLTTQQLKKKVNRYASDAQAKYSSIYDEQKEQKIKTRESFRSILLSSKLLNCSDESAKSVGKDQTAEMVTKLKRQFERFRVETQNNNKLLRMILGQCLGHNIEFMPTTKTLNSGIQCRINDEDRMSFPSFKESEQNLQMRNRLVIDINDNLNPSELGGCPEPKISINVQSLNDIKDETFLEDEDEIAETSRSSGLVKLHRIDLFEDEGFKRICKDDDDSIMDESREDSLKHVIDHYSAGREYQIIIRDALQDQDPASKQDL